MKKDSDLFRGNMKGDAIAISDWENFTRNRIEIYLQFGNATFRDLTASCLSQALLFGIVSTAYL